MNIFPGLGQSVPEALKQNTAYLLWTGTFHSTSPVFPIPHFFSGVIRGMTTIFSATQPYLLVTIQESVTQLPNFQLCTMMMMNL